MFVSSLIHRKNCKTKQAKNRKNCKTKQAKNRNSMLNKNWQKRARENILLKRDNFSYQRPGLNPTISKNREKSCFLYIQRNFKQANFSCKTEKNSAQIFWCC
jgi:hypothetical protein